MSNFEQEFDAIQNKLKGNISFSSGNVNKKYVIGIISVLIILLLVLRPSIVRNSQKKFDFQKFVIWSLFLSFIVVAIFYHSYFIN
jgi:hypothetical protein